MICFGGEKADEVKPQKLHLATIWIYQKFELKTMKKEENLQTYVKVSYIFLVVGETTEAKESNKGDFMWNIKKKEKEISISVNSTHAESKKLFLAHIFLVASTSGQNI